MPWRNKYITSRRHPLAIAAYLLTLGMGVFFLVGLFDSATLNRAIGSTVQLCWQVLLTAGGAAALAGVLWPQRRMALEDALTMEAAGAGACGLGLTVYALAIIVVAGWAAPVWLLLGVLAGGALARANQARRDARRVRHLAVQLETGQP